ncbi:MAG: DUF4350 domain-containing protein [Deltaproteobacteria bacterium]|nr:DUF4350 domain-containing protein [Deltaproteobacteria bacterium]
MIGARSVIAVIVALAVLSLVFAVVEVASPPDNDGRGRDSYGVHAQGTRALFEVLQRLDVPVRRGIDPSQGYLAEASTLVLWEPWESLVRLEPGHMKTIDEWVRGGGRVVLAPLDDDPAHDPLAAQEGAFAVNTTTLLELGIENVRAISIASTKPPEATADAETEANDDSDEDAPADSRALVRVDEEGVDIEPLLERWRQADAFDREATVTAVRVSGDWPALSAIREVAVPDDDGGRVLDGDGLRRATARLMTTDDQETLAARFERGEGEVVLIADPSLFQNWLVASADNAALALATVGSGPVVIDEFHHALNVRGNPMWLLAQHPYGVIAVMILLTTGLWIARRAVALGPPLETPPPSRRQIGEYVDAMAHLFERKKAWRHLLGELRDGTLWSVRRRYRSHERAGQMTRLYDRVERRDPDLAASLRRALDETQNDLNTTRRLSASHARRRAMELDACLTATFTRD